MADDSLDTVSNLTEVVGLSISPCTQNVINNCVESLMQDASLVIDENVDVLSRAKTETTLQGMENETSNSVYGNGKRRKLRPRNRRKLLLKGKRPKPPAKAFEREKASI